MITELSTKEIADFTPWEAIIFDKNKNELMTIMDRISLFENLHKLQVAVQWKINVLYIFKKFVELELLKKEKQSQVNDMLIINTREQLKARIAQLDSNTLNHIRAREMIQSILTGIAIN